MHFIDISCYCMENKMVHLLSWCLYGWPQTFSWPRTWVELTRFSQNPTYPIRPIRPAPPAPLDLHRQSMANSGHQSTTTVSAWLHIFVGKWPAFGHVRRNSRLSLFFVIQCFRWHQFYCHCSIQSFSTHPTLYCFNIFLPLTLQRHNYARWRLKK